MRSLVVVVLLLAALPARAQDEEDAPPVTGRLYGYIDAQYRHSLGAGLHAHEEAGEEEGSEEHSNGFDLNLTIMLQGTVVERFRYFLNLAGPGAGQPGRNVPLEVRNAWVEAALWRELLVLRVGKTYRRFGLYNEILDATPTFIGIEAPEMLVAGHLLTTRTTNLMLHGALQHGDHAFQWALFTGQDEHEKDQFPLGADLRWDWDGKVLVGSSFYWTGGDAVPTRAPGEGPAQGGVMSWMKTDRYVVFGGYAQLRLDALLVQAEYWHAPHDARRDPDRVLQLVTAELNPRQRERFWNGVPTVTRDDINVDGDYSVDTFWARVGWELGLGGWGSVTPYAHFELYRNPEAIENESLGGNEAGISDDGQFMRVAGGFVYRPIFNVALKGELNPHFQTVDGETRVFTELRTSLSLYWEL